MMKLHLYFEFYDFPLILWAWDLIYYLDLVIQKVLLSRLKMSKACLISAMDESSFFKMLIISSSLF